ncbi:hypothetical protein Btru_048162 [Bulinus truncatus]|nr:hypothetical protein Btru_048162 [Bulinus truncatus]
MVLTSYYSIGSVVSFTQKYCNTDSKNILFVIDCRLEVREQIDFINQTVDYLRYNRNWTSLKVSYKTHEDRKPTSLEVLTANITEKANEISNKCTGKEPFLALTLLTRKVGSAKQSAVTITFVFMTKAFNDLYEYITYITNEDEVFQRYTFFIINYSKNSLPVSNKADNTSRKYIHYTDSFRNLNIQNFFTKICDLTCTNSSFTFESSYFQKSFYHVDFTNISHKEVLKINSSSWDDLKPLKVHLGLNFDSLWEAYFWSSGNPFTFYNELPDNDTTQCVYFNYTKSTNETLNIEDNKSIWKYLYLMDCEQILYGTYLVCERHQLMQVDLNVQIKPVNKPDTLGLIDYNYMVYYWYESLVFMYERNRKHCNSPNPSHDDDTYYLCTKPKHSPSVYTYVRVMLIQESRDQSCTSSCQPFYTVHSESKINITTSTYEQYCYADDLQLPSEKCLSKKGKLNQDIPTVTCNTNKDVSFKCLHLHHYGCTDNTHLQNCETFQCPEGFVKCPGSYCIPLYAVFNTRRQCPFGQEKNIFSNEKQNCLSQTAFKITNTCIHSKLHRHFLNKTKNENITPVAKMCNDTCPEGFSCLTFISEDKVNLFLQVELRLYNISNSLLPERGIFFYVPFLKILEISISDCKVQNVDKALELWNTEETVILDLSMNQISDSNYLRSLQSMTNLLFLNLSHNDYLSINKEFVFPYSLEEIDLSCTSVTSLPENCFENLANLRILNLRHTKITLFEDMGLPGNFILDTLNIQGLVMSDVRVDFFKGLTVRKSLFTSDFKLCCQQILGDNISPTNCHAPDDAISSCKHIVGDASKRILVWVVGLMTIAGNGIVLIYRVVWSREKIFQTAYGLFVTGLAVSDLLMGVYLMIIAVVDVVYADVYVVYDTNWRKSFLCNFSGVLSTLSSETSTFLIGLITLDRFISISYPFSAHHTSTSLKWKGFISTWVIGFVLALTPAVVPKWQIYSSNGLCLALPLSTIGSDKLPGWEFSMAVYVILNFILFLFIALGQVGIFMNVIKKINLPSMRHCSERRTQDINIAKKLAFVAMSDFLCWFPIGIMGILSLIGKEFDKETYAWMAVFVLPVNSALNPLIYTIPVIIDRIKSKH